MKKAAATATRQATVGDKELARVTKSVKRALSALVPRLEQLIQHPSDQFTGVLKSHEFFQFIKAAKNAGLITKRENGAVLTELKSVIQGMR